MHLFPISHENRSRSFGRHRLVLTARRHFAILLNERSAFAFFLFDFLSFLFSQQHLAVSDSLEYIFGDDAHFLALEGIVQEEDVGSFLLKPVDLCDPSGCDHFVVFDEFGHVAFAIGKISEFGVSGEQGFDGLLPLVDALDAVD